MFEHFKKSLKQFGFKGILATVSYLFLIGFIGELLSEITPMGKLGYIISFLGIPSFFYATIWLSGTKILEAFRQDWLEASIYFHFLIILNALIWTIFLNLFNQSELNHKLLWVIKKTFGK